MEQKKFYQLTQLTSGITSAGIVGTNEICQRLVQAKVIEYQTPYGYLTDIFAIPLISGLICTKYKNPVIPIIGATIYSVAEISGLTGKFDKYDILSYWVGAGLALGIMKLGESKKVKNVVSNLNPFKNKKLEELIS